MPPEISQIKFTISYSLVSEISSPLGIMAEIAGIGKPYC
jgi:hypothetical protein